jgi:Holliday junction resolvase
MGSLFSEATSSNHSDLGNGVFHKRYQKGVRLERKCVNYAKGQGMQSTRSAGSKSKIDFFAIDNKAKRVFFVQSKASKKLSKNAKQNIASKLPDTDEYFVTFAVINSFEEFKKLLE